VVTRYLLRCLVMLMLSLYGSTLLAATLEARVDKKELLVGEHLILTLALINSDTRLRATGVNPNIDLTILTDHFELGIPQASNRYSPFRNRGRASSEISVTLFPKNEGEFIIPAFSVDGEASQPIAIVAHSAAPDDTPEVFTRSGVYKSKLWLREQTIAYIDLYHRTELASAKLGGAIDSEPKLQIQLSQLPQTDRTEIHNGIRYNVTRSAWGVAPAINQPIKLFLPDVWVETQAGKQLRFPFKDIQIETRPLPESVPPLTLVGRPQLTQSPLAKSVKQYQNIQLELTLQAPSNIINLSPTAPDLPFSPQLKTYADRGLRQSVEGSNDGSTKVTYQYQLMPLSAGSFQLPNWRVPYFDPERGIMDEARLQGQTLEVAAAPIPPIENSLPPTADLTPAAGSEQGVLPWQVATLITSLLWLITLLVWRYQTMNRPTATIEAKKQHALPTAPTHPLQQKLLVAFKAQTLEQGLTQWELHHGVDEEMRAIIHKIQRHCYGAREERQEINHLQAGIEKLTRKITAQNSSKIEKEPWRAEAFTAPHKLL